MANYDKEEGTKATGEEELMNEKLEHLDEAYCKKERELFETYKNVIANSLDDVRPCMVMVRLKFEFTSEKPIFQNLRRVPPTYNQIIRKELDRLLQT